MIVDKPDRGAVLSYAPSSTTDKGLNSHRTSQEPLPPSPPPQIDGNELSNYLLNHKKNNFQPATYWLFVWWVVCWFQKANMLTSGPELDMIWTDLTGDGAERERRRMLTNPEALLKIWRILHWPLGRPRNIMMTFDLWLTEPLAQGFVMAYGLGPMKDGSWPCWRWKCLIGHNVSPIQHSVPGQLLWKDDVSGKTRQWWQGGGSCGKVLSKAGSRPF